MLTTLAVIPIVAFLVLVLFGFLLLRLRALRWATAQTAVAGWKRQCLNDDRQLELEAVEQTTQGVAVDRVLVQFTTRRAQLLAEGRPSDPANWNEDDLNRVAAERLAVAEQAIRSQLVWRAGVGLVLVAATTVVSMAVLYQGQPPLADAPAPTAGAVSDPAPSDDVEGEFLPPPAVSADQKTADGETATPSDPTPSGDPANQFQPQPQADAPPEPQTLFSLNLPESLI